MKRKIEKVAVVGAGVRSPSEGSGRGGGDAASQTPRVRGERLVRADSHRWYDRSLDRSDSDTSVQEDDMRLQVSL